MNKMNKTDPMKNKDFLNWLGNRRRKKRLEKKLEKRQQDNQDENKHYRYKKIAFDTLCHFLHLSLGSGFLDNCSCVVLLTYIHILMLRSTSYFHAIVSERRKTTLNVQQSLINDPKVILLHRVPETN